MICHECELHIGERQGYVTNRGRVFHARCAPSFDYDRGYRDGIIEAAERAEERAKYHAELGNASCSTEATYIAARIRAGVTE